MRTITMMALSVCLVAQAEPYLKWVHIRNDISTDANLALFESVIARAGACGYNGVLWDSGLWGEGVDFRWDADRLARIERAKAKCRESGIEIVPMLWSVGRAMSLVDRDPTLAETDMLRDVPHVARGGRAVFAPQGNTVVFSTNGVIRIDKAGVPNASFRFRVKPRTKYRVTALVDTDGVRRIPILAPPRWPVRGSFGVSVSEFKDGKRIGGSRESYNERRIGCVKDIDLVLDFMTQDNDEEQLEFHIWNSATSGWAEFRELKVEEIGVTAPVIREGAPFVVRSRASGRVYEQGRDYVVPKSKVIWSPRRCDGAVEIELVKGGAIAEGEQLLVDYASALVRSQSQVGVCMANPALRRFFDETAPEIDRLFGHPRKWFLSMDEIRSGGTCGLCRSDRGENLARLVAQCLADERDAIRRVRPDAQVFAWSDMYDPQANAGNPGKDFALCRGDFAFTEFRAPKDVVSVVWAGPHEFARQSLEYFRGLGVPTLHGTYYDCDSIEHPRCRMSIALDREMRAKGTCIGTMYTTWLPEGKYTLLEPFAELMEDMK